MIIDCSISENLVGCQRLMGKKKVVKKTKELSVAIVESSAMSGDSQQEITPRKRGRPRKIIIKDEEEASAEMKKLKTSEVEEPENKEGAEGESEEKRNLQPQNEQPTRSRARRKSKPRKSC